MTPATTLAARLDHWSGTWGDRIAVAFREHTWTFAEIAAQSERCANALAAIGVDRGSRVGLLKPNRPDWLFIAFAVWRRGAVLVPINTLYRQNELRHALELAEVEVLIAEERFLGNHYRDYLDRIVPGLTGSPDDAVGDGPQGSGPRSTSLPALRQILFSNVAGSPPAHDWENHLSQPHQTAGAPTVEPHDDAAIFFTSGSTSKPKGVIHTHSSMLRSADNVGDRLGLDTGDRTYGYLPLFFNGGLVGVALATLGRGGAVLLQDVFSPPEAVALMETHNCTVFFGWPHQAEAIARDSGFDRERIRLRKGPGATAPWAADLLVRDHQCVGAWGMSETGPMAVCSHYDEPLEVRRRSHGVAMPGLDLRIADEHGAPVPTGVDGEILIRGSSLMRTYCDAAPAECFDAEGFFHTGDRGRLDGDGRLSFLGRLRDVIKTAGVNVAAAEVEEVLAQHPSVDTAYVVPVPHRSRGENVAAFVVSASTTRSADGDDTDAILHHCRTHLAAYKVPRHVWWLFDDELPTLGSGKVDRQTLRRMAAERVDETGEVDR